MQQIQPLELPNRIKPLDPQLVNRIAAGEVIQRPFNAIKELIENCLDAGATQISVIIKEAGLKLIQIQDNGCGINKEDLEIICERFTTSKLQTFDDLKSINTFGFRGEALASISHVSRLTIISKTAKSQCAYKASYSDGRLNPDGIKPCAAASKGTQIQVEDLFYNSLIRRNALRSNSEEFSKIYEVVSRYSIHNYHVGFYLKRANENSFDLKTTGLSKDCKIQSKHIDNEKFLIENVGLVYGTELSKELERISIDYDENLSFEMNGYISNAKYTQLKSMIFVLFINERLVDCNPLKKTLQSVFSSFMPKNSYPFVYLNIKMNPNNVDVNIHPSKHEVRYLYQDEIISKIQVCIEKQLMNSNLSRTYYVKNLTIDTFLPSSNCTLKESTENEQTATAAKSPIVYPYQLTRVDSRERTLDSYKHRTSISSPQILTSQSKLAKQDDDEKDDGKSPFRNQTQERIVQFKSLNELRDEVEENASKKARNFLKDMSFVGCIENELALVQHKTGLYLVNTKVLSHELFYQIALFNFGNFGYFRFEEPILIKDLALIALDDPEACWSPDDGDKHKLASKCAKLLSSKAQMLDDYFSIKINGKSDEASLEAVPILLEDYEPEILDLPMFILRLSTEVNWAEEKECFKSICNELGVFYAVKSIQEDSDMKNSNKPNKKWLIEHVIYQYFRKSLLPSTKNEDLFFKLVDLHDLYKVFERC